MTCSITGCEEPGSPLCEGHADIAAHRDTPAARRVRADGDARVRAKIAEQAVAIRASQPTLPPTGQAAIVCPHCLVQGKVNARRTRRKKGVSGGKATGAVLTGGLSLLATGLSRKERATELHCSNCGTTWDA